MSTPTHRRVARALRPGGLDVIEIGTEDLGPLKSGEALVLVEAAALNPAETLIRSGNYIVRLPFPYALGGEGSGTVVATGPGVSIRIGARVCWAAIVGSCATYITARFCRRSLQRVVTGCSANVRSWPRFSLPATTEVA